MFGQMTISPLMELRTNCPVNGAIAALLKAADQPEIVRWIEFPYSLLLFAIVSGNPQSGAIYWLDRKQGTCGGYNVQQFESLFQYCDLVSLIDAQA